MSKSQAVKVKGYKRTDGVEVKAHDSTRAAAEPKIDVAAASASGPAASAGEVVEADFGLAAPEPESYAHLVSNSFEGQSITDFLSYEYGRGQNGVVFGFAFDYSTGQLYNIDKFDWENSESFYDRDNVVKRFWESYTTAEEQEELVESLVEGLGAYMAGVRTEKDLRWEEAGSKGPGCFWDGPDTEGSYSAEAELEGLNDLGMDNIETAAEELPGYISFDYWSGGFNPFDDGYNFDARDSDGNDTGISVSFSANPFSMDELRASFKAGVAELDALILEAAKEDEEDDEEDY